MKRNNFLVNALAAVAVAGSLVIGTAPLSAQCRRPASSQSTNGTVSPLTLQNGLTSSALGNMNPLQTSINANLIALRYQTQIARQQALLLEQQRYIQNLQAMHQQALAQQQAVGQQTPHPNDVGQTPVAAERREQQLRRAASREASARKIYAAAIAAEQADQAATAQRHFRRVLRLQPESTELGQHAREGLERLAAGATVRELAPSQPIPAKTSTQLVQWQ